MNHHAPRAAIYTLGCRVNQYESDAVEAELESLGFSIVPFSEASDVYIINTCAVTAESERKSRQIIRRARAVNPDAFVLVMGCFSQIKAEAVKKIPGVDYVCGHRNKLSVAEIAFKTGFEDPYYFSRIFKKYTNMSPSEYRNRLK